MWRKRKAEIEEIKGQGSDRARVKDRTERKRQTQARRGLRGTVKRGPRIGFAQSQRALSIPVQ